MVCHALLVVILDLRIPGRYWVDTLSILPSSALGVVMFFFVDDRPHHLHVDRVSKSERYMCSPFSLLGIDMCSDLCFFEGVRAGLLPDSRTPTTREMEAGTIPTNLAPQFSSTQEHASTLSQAQAHMHASAHQR